MLEQVRSKISDAIEQGITGNCFRAERALLIYKEIGAHADQINKEGYGGLFSAFQESLLKEIVTSISMIYERNDRHKLRSIPWVLDYLQNNEHAAAALDMDPERLRTLVKNWQERMDVVLDDAHKEALQKIKAVRDKRMAHDELIPEDKINRPRWNELEELLDTAKAIHAEMGFELLKIIYRVDDGSYFLTGDALKSQQSLKRLLEAALD